MNRNELLTGDQNILSRTKYFCPGQNFFCPRQNFFVPDKTFFVHAEGRGISITCVHCCVFLSRFVQVSRNGIMAVEIAFWGLKINEEYPDNIEKITISGAVLFLKLESEHEALLTPFFYPSAI